MVGNILIKRELYLKRIRKLIGTEEVKVITGVRRSGKTCLLKLIIDELKEKGVSEENIFYISFESSRYDDITNYKELNKFIFDLTCDAKDKIYLLFDEIQEVIKWEKSINSFRVDLDCDIYITGSNSKLLSGEFSTLLSGRYITIRVYPFSFKEVLDYYEKNENITKEREIQIFNEYLDYGGFPGLLKYDKFEKHEFLKDIYNSIILRDIINRSNIKNTDLLMILLEYMISNTGKLFSSTNVINYIKSNNRPLIQEIKNPSASTILRYVNYIKNAFLMYNVKLTDIKGKEIFKKTEKFYVTDPGFYYLFHDETERDMGSLLETIVYVELLRRNYEVTVGRIGDNEVDFLAKKSGEKCYIQVSESIKGEQTRERELRSLNKIQDNYPKYILTLDEIKYPTNGIIQVNMIDFLKRDY